MPVIGIGKIYCAGLWQRRKRHIADRFRLAGAGAFNGDEARAEAVQAGKIFVARRLVDLAFAAKLGFFRRHGDAVRRDAAIAAAFADGFVDEHALLRIGERAALAPAAFFSGTRLVIDHRRHAFDGAQIALHLIQVFAVVNVDAGREAEVERIFIRLVGDDDDALHTFGADLLRDNGRV